ncbi:hypothetical protein B0H19DRAFT_1268214 [Mycena capillaripes]|nr:hypothetical protein B0H19DRAFT_1268214 [Mycena capillaripes]
MTSTSNLPPYSPTSYATTFSAHHSASAHLRRKAPTPRTYAHDATPPSYAIHAQAAHLRTVCPPCTTPLPAILLIAIFSCSRPIYTGDYRSNAVAIRSVSPRRSTERVLYTIASAIPRVSHLMPQ